MMPATLITDSGATKAEWCFINHGKKSTVYTQGISPYFLSTEQMAAVFQHELVPQLDGTPVEQIFYYGTGCRNPANAKSVKAALGGVFSQAAIKVTHDLMAAARAVCGHQKGVAGILGTGSNSCYYDGKKIVKNSPGLGYILGDEGSGTYLGKKVLQYYLYHTFDDDLRARFDARFVTTPVEILEKVYKQPMANRYLASFTLFLAENRGHYMIENILEDGLNDFFFQHLSAYKEARKLPVSFVGGVAYGFRDVVQHLCELYEFELGKILKNPMEGLVTYHTEGEKI